MLALFAYPDVDYPDADSDIDCRFMLNVYWLDDQKLKYVFSIKISIQTINLQEIFGGKSKILYFNNYI